MTARPWIAKAACLDMDSSIFYPPEDDYVPPEIRELCASCPVREECLEWALLHETDGVWAGTSPRRRRRMRKAERLRVNSPGSYLVRGMGAKRMAG